MNTIVKFRRDSFRQGVNDVLTLSPLRDAIKTVTKNTHSVFSHTSKTADAKPPSRETQAFDERKAARRG